MPLNKKIYGDFDKNDWLQISNMTEADVPETIILHGEDGNVAENIAEWEPAFDSILSRPRWNMIIGQKNLKTIGFANVIWAPMVALVVHKFAMMGTRRFIQIGYCGGLSTELKYGDILLVESAKAEDGVSSQYFPARNTFGASEKFLSRAESVLRKQNHVFKKGSVVTTSAMFLETEQIVKNWQSQNYLGVDGETATTFAVAEKFGAESISLLTCSDHIGIGDTFFNSDLERALQEEGAFGKIQNVAWELCLT